MVYNILSASGIPVNKSWNSNINFNAITNSNINNVIFMEVSKEIENSSSIELIINTRINKYLYKLKQKIIIKNKCIKIKNKIN